MSDRLNRMQEYIDGRISPVNGEPIPIDKIKQADRRLRKMRSGKGEDGVFVIDDTEAETKTQKIEGTE